MKVTKIEVILTDIKIFRKLYIYIKTMQHNYKHTEFHSNIAKTHCFVMGRLKTCMFIDM